MSDPRRLIANGVDFAYQEAGPADGPLALCLHGFPDTARTWRHLLPALGDEGWHAVAPWMRGYHPTGLAPDGVYQSAALALDAVAIVEALSPDRPAALVGHDWGAVAATGAAMLRPERVRAVASLALPHPAIFGATLLGNLEQLRRGWYAWLFQLPGLPELLLGAEDGALVDFLWSTWSPGWRRGEEDRAALRELFARPEVVAAALGYYRQTFGPAFDGAAPRTELSAVQDAVSFGRLAVPALFAAGADDGCFDATVVPQSAAMCDAAVRCEVLDGCGHFLHLERPDAVNQMLLDFLGPAA